jgi:hypothetical protein
VSITVSRYYIDSRVGMENQVLRGAQHDKAKFFTLLKSSQFRKGNILWCADFERTEGRLRSWNQVFRGAQHDNEKSLLFWGLSIVEDGEANREILWRAAQGNRRSFTELESGVLRSST